MELPSLEEVLGDQLNSIHVGRQLLSSFVSEPEWFRNMLKSTGGIVFGEPLYFFLKREQLLKDNRGVLPFHFEKSALRGSRLDVAVSLRTIGKHGLLWWKKYLTDGERMSVILSKQSVRFLFLSVDMP